MDSRSDRPPLIASQLVGGSWTFLKAHPGSAVTAAAFPLTLSLLVGGISLIAADSGAPQKIVGSAQFLLDVLPWTLFGVAWHRLVLSSEEPRLSVAWSSHHTRFALFLVVWRSAHLLLPVPEQESVSFGLLLVVFITAMISLSYLQARFSLFLPAAAIAVPMSPSDAWSSSRGYGGALFWSGVLSAVFALLLCIPLIALVAYLQGSPSSAAQLAVVPVGCAMQLVFEALAVGALSFAYQAIRARSSAV